MSNVNESAFYPKKAGKEISFMLYNSKNIPKLIEKRKLDLIDTMNSSPAAWLRSRNTDANTLEDIVVRIDEDRIINRLKKWQIFLASFFKILKNYERPIYYQFIEMRYIKKIDSKEIARQLNLTEKELKNLEIHIKWTTYRYAIKDKLFDEEVVGNVPM